MRSRPDLSPAAVRELDAIDRALAGDPVDPDLSELRDLALALRDERPEPADGFLLELEAWMAERAEHRRLALPRVRRGMLLPALGAASVVALGSTVALVLRDDGRKPTTASVIRSQRPATGKVAPGALPAQTGAPLAKTAPAAPETAGGQAGAATPAPPAADAVAAPPAAARGRAASSAPRRSRSPRRRARSRMSPTASFA